jgi:hypothetical protein
VTTPGESPGGGDLDQLSRRIKCREVNKERLRHDTHLESHKEIIEVRRSNLHEKVSLETTR